jgi:hypothetical protein
MLDVSDTTGAKQLQLAMDISELPFMMREVTDGRSYAGIKHREISAGTKAILLGMAPNIFSSSTKGH